MNLEIRTLYAEVATAALTELGSTLPFALSVSIGGAELRAGEEMEGLIRRADAALYRAKAAGRNRSEMDGVFETQMISARAEGGPSSR